MTEVAATPKDAAAEPQPEAPRARIRFASWGRALLRSTVWPALVATVVSVGLNHLSDERLKRAEVEMARQTTRIEAMERSRRDAVENFVREATSLNVLVPAFAAPVSRENRVDQQARDRILENLVKQKTLLDDLAARLPPEGRPNVSDYEKAVEAFHTAVLRVRGVDDGMATFWSRASDLVAARDDVIEALRGLRG